jgi:hypothetical protein
MHPHPAAARIGWSWRTLSTETDPNEPSVKKGSPSGRRWVQVEVEVPGTPEEVWQAIATGPGISSWFVPTARGARRNPLR